jgi:uncharacterized membrane protein YhdT
MRRGSITSIVTTLLLVVPLAIALSAAGASPLATQNATVGPYTVLLSFYSFPRAGQSFNMTIESDRPGQPLTFSAATLNPAPGTDGNTITVILAPDGENQGAYNVQATPPVTGKWLLHVTIAGAAGVVTGNIPINVTGPPAIPLWLGWSIGLVPLPFILAFMAYQFIWRKKML